MEIPTDEVPLEPSVPGGDRPSSHHLPRGARPHPSCALTVSSSPPRAPGVPSGCSQGGPCFPDPAFRAAASRAGPAGCRPGPARGGSAAAGGASSSGGSAGWCGGAGKCAVSDPQALAQDLASVGRHKSDKSGLPYGPSAPSLDAGLMLRLVSKSASTKS